MASACTQTLSGFRTTSSHSIMSTRPSIKPAKTTKPLPVARRNGKGKDKINLALPHFIHCSICSMDRPLEAYSNAQLKQLRGRIHANGGDVAKGLATAKCEDCTLDPSEQRKCQSCGQPKALSEFSKAQRFGGELRCIQCIDFYLRFERHSDDQKLLEGPKATLAIEMERSEEETVSMIPGAGPLTQTRITSNDQNALVVRRVAAASRIEHLPGHANPPNELSPSDTEGTEIDATVFL